MKYKCPQCKREFHVIEVEHGKLAYTNVSTDEFWENSNSTPFCIYCEEESGGCCYVPLVTSKKHGEK